MTVDPRTKAAPSALQRGLETALGAPLAIRRVPIDSIHLDPANARSHPQRNLDAIRSSLARFGQAEPLVVHRPTGRVIGGNGRLVAMKALGWTECDIVELDIADSEATALGIALNRTAELAEWDDDTLAQLLQSLRADGAIDGLGFDAKPECEVTTGPNLGAGSGWLTVNGARDYRSGVRRTPKAATCHYSTPSCIRARRTYGFGVASLHRFALAERPGSTRSRVATTPAAWQSSVPAAEHGGECRQRPLWGCATPCEPSAIHRADRRSGRASQTR